MVTYSQSQAMKTPSTAIYSIGFQRHSSWRQRFLPKMGPNKDISPATCPVPRPWRMFFPRRYSKLLHCVASPPSPSVVPHSTEPLQKAIDKAAQSRARKPGKAQPTKKICCYRKPWGALSFHIPNFHIWEFDSQPWKPYQQRSELAGLKKERTKVSYCLC